MEFNKKILVNHILFWGIVFISHLFTSTSSDLFQQSLETTILKLPLLIIAAYAFNMWQVPHYLKPKRYLAFVLSMVFILVVLIFLFRLIGYFYLDKFCVNGPYPLISLVDFPFYLFSFHFPALIMYFFITNKEQELEREKILQLENAKIATELKYLKGQLNPHFLFNTLNNLYSYVIAKSPKAADMVLQLSEILDYILYRSQQVSVRLAEEIQTIDNYIALEQIKYGERLQINFKKELLNDAVSITPLILLSIVENAFKHGVRDSIIKPKINIELVQFDSHIEFNVWNTKNETQHNNETDTYKKGIGLSNIKRQLDLLYPKNHVLEIDETDVFFNLKLTLNIT
jgi:two-component system, LytTR family, sensor kinase